MVIQLPGLQYVLAEKRHIAFDCVVTTLARQMDSFIPDRFFPEISHS